MPFQAGTAQPGWSSGCAPEEPEVWARTRRALTGARAPAYQCPLRGWCESWFSGGRLSHAPAHPASLLAQPAPDRPDGAGRLRRGAGARPRQVYGRAASPRARHRRGPDQGRRSAGQEDAPERRWAGERDRQTRSCTAGELPRRHPRLRPHQPAAHRHTPARPALGRQPALPGVPDPAPAGVRGRRAGSSPGCLASSPSNPTGCSN